MLLTTTQILQDRKIIEYKGTVFGEVVAGINFLKDMGAGLRNIFGGRSQGYEEELIQARAEALEEMKRRAEAIGANAILGIDIDYNALGTANNMLLVTVTGTAVVYED